MIYEVLKKTGLKDKEIDIYLFLLEYGTQTAPRISKETGVDKATTYRFLEELERKHLVATTHIENIRNYSAVNPKQIIENIEDTKDHVNAILPDLEKLSKASKQETQVQMFVGDDTPKVLLKDILAEGKEYYIIGNDEAFTGDSEFFSKVWLKRVEQNKIKGSLLLTKKEIIPVGKLETVRYIDTKLDSNITTTIYGNKVGITIHSDPKYLIIIDSKEYAQGNKKTFDFLHKTSKAKPYN